MKLYEPMVIPNVNVAGIVVGTIKPGETGNILTKSFITSDDIRFYTYAPNILQFFVDKNELSQLDRLLVLIKNDNKAYVYRVFPMSVLFKPKKGVKKGEVIFYDDIADIIQVEFTDAVTNIKIENDDQVIWLFREGLKFCLYFDFSRSIPSEARKIDMGYYFRKTLFAKLYEFTSQSINFDKLLVDGWFPFIRLIGPRFDKLINHYETLSDYEAANQEIISYYTDEIINGFTVNWFKHPIFNEKKELIEAGLSSYFQNNQIGNISCIKILSSEIEGILRSSLYKDSNVTNPTTEQLKIHIVNKALKQFNTLESLGFPHKFKDYLDNVMFKGFNIADTEIPTSRHSVAHGVARLDNYSRIRALQLILLMDQIFFFL